MGYVAAVKTWIAGEILYAADLNAMNTNILNVLIPEPSAIAQGDILYRGASQWEKLAAGTAKQVLITGGASANPSFYSFPKFAANKNATNQTGVVTSTYTKITFTTEEYDIGSAYDATNSKWVPGILGKGHINAQILWTAAVNQTLMMISIYKNGVAYKQSAIEASGTGTQRVSISCDVPVDVVTDYFEIYGYQESGGDKIVAGTITDSWFNGYMLP